MNKKTILSSLLLAGSTAQLSAAEISASHSAAINARASLINQVYVSNNLFDGDNAPNHAGHDNNFRLRLTFIAIAEQDAYTFEGQDPKLDYEVVIESVDQVSGIVSDEGYHYFAKKLDADGTFDLYFCDSTSVCSEGRGKTTLKVTAESLQIADAYAVHLHEFPQITGPVSFHKAP